MNLPKYPKIECRHCRQSFHPNANRKAFCSLKCSKEYRIAVRDTKLEDKLYQVSKCQGCGVSFVGCRKFCSRECSGMTTGFQATHGNSTKIVARCTPSYKAWQSIKQRCLNPKTKGFESYGGRGIMICDRWLESFENFLADVGERPSLLHSIDRFPNNDGNYEPGNVRWATRAEQQRNRRNTVLEHHEPAQIRWLKGLGYKQRDVARFFGLTETTVSGIIRGRTWT